MALTGTLLPKVTAVKNQITRMVPPFVKKQSCYINVVAYLLSFLIGENKSITFVVVMLQITSTYYFKNQNNSLNFFHYPYQCLKQRHKKVMRM